MADPGSKMLEAFELDSAGKYKSLDSFPKLKLDLDGFQAELDVAEAWQRLDEMA